MVLYFKLVLSSTNVGMVKLLGFCQNCPNYILTVRVLIIYHGILWQCYSLINHSNQLLVIVFHQPASGDTRENFHFAVDWQNCA